MQRIRESNAGFYLFIDQKLSKMVWILLFINLFQPPIPKYLFLDPLILYDPLYWTFFQDLLAISQLLDYLTSLNPQN